MKQLLVFVFSVLFFSAVAQAGKRTPVPFQNPYRDGYVWVLWSDTYSDVELAAQMDRIGVSGARTIVIPAFGCQSDINSSDVGACDIDSRPFALKLGAMALKRGFYVSFIPIIVTPKWDWRGDFEPKDTATWFANYTAWMQKFARDVAALGPGVNELVVASEFKKLYKKTAEWKDFLKKMRPLFSGPLVVTVNWDTLDYGFWDEADAIGISTYFPLSAEENPSQAVLDKAWEKHYASLMAISKKYGRPLYFTELGYPSSKTAAKEPWSFTPATPDAELQSRCFSAFTKYWATEKALARVNVWATGDNREASYQAGFDPIGKPAEATLREFFKKRPELGVRRF